MPVTVLDNNMEDADLIREMQSVVSQLDISFSNKAKQMVNNKKRQGEIEQYYNSLYQRQLGVIKKLVLFTCLGIVGSILFQNGTISEKVFILYEAIVLSVGFILILYDLWDIYLRDSNYFDEYDYASLSAPPKMGGEIQTDFNSIELAYQPTFC